MEEDKRQKQEGETIKDYNTRIKGNEADVLGSTILKNSGSDSESTDDDDETNLNQTDRNLCYKTFGNEGIVIGGLFPNDFSCEVVLCEPDEKNNILSAECFPDGFKFESDVFSITESNTGFPLDVTKTEAKDIFVNTMVPSQEANDFVYFDYRGAVRFENTWQFVEPVSKAGYMAFQVDRIDCFCLISFIREEKVKISPEGSQFVSSCDSRIKVIFPPNAVDKDKNITFKIHPVDLCNLAEISKRDDSDDHIYAVTPRIYTNHIQFKKSIEIQLPIQFTPGIMLKEDKYKYDVYRWEYDGTFDLTDIEPLLMDGIVSFSTTGFCGYVAAAKSAKRNKTTMTNKLKQVTGVVKLCKILIFVVVDDNRHQSVIIQCVESKNVKKFCTIREEYGYRFVKESISEDKLIAEHTAMTVDVSGLYLLAKTSRCKQQRVYFVPTNDTFANFQIEKKKEVMNETYVRFFISNKKDLNVELAYYPNRKSKYVQRGNKENHKTERKIDNFFTDKGVLELTKFMNFDIVFQVCIQMDMPRAQIDNICKQYLEIVQRNLTLVQTALDKKPDDQKLSCLNHALERTGQITLAEKVKKIWLTNRELDTIYISLE